jgi:isopentenyl-diphosphate delta-isomerase
VEAHRAPTRIHAEVARSFADWGIPTADAIRYVREAVPQMMIFASGGLRTGIDVAKCIALGAKLGGIAGPFVQAAAESEEAVRETIEILQTQLRIAMFASGAADLSQLATLELIEG